MKTFGPMQKTTEHSQEVLIVDDEIDICYLLSGILRQRNLHPGFVNSLAEARFALNKNHPTLLFLDNRLPDGLGLDFISFVKKTYPLTKIIMITAHDSSMERNRAYAEGADLFIGKPLNRELINAAIDKLIN